MLPMPPHTHIGVLAYAYTYVMPIHLNTHLNMLAPIYIQKQKTAYNMLMA